MMQAVERWSNSQVHDTVAAIARQPIYATPLRQSLAGRVFRFIFERIADFFTALKGSSNARIVLIAALAVVALVIVGRVALSSRVDERRRRMGAGARGTSTRADYWSTAAGLAAAGDYAGASHALYAAVLESMSRAGAVKFHSSKTSGDYVRELRRRRSPAMQDFRTFARDCDRIIYGTTAATEAEYRAVMSAAERAARAVVAA
jgi:hypothetical protein